MDLDPTIPSSPRSHLSRQSSYAAAGPAEVAPAWQRRLLCTDQICEHGVMGMR
jgi:hypothetical protein